MSWVLASLVAPAKLQRRADFFAPFVVVRPGGLDGTSVFWVEANLGEGSKVTSFP